MTHTTVPVIFDLDGTLVDPAGGITDGIAAALTELGLPVPGPDLLAAMIGPKLSDSLLGRRRRSGGHSWKTSSGSTAQHYLARGIAQSRLYPGIRGLLEGLRGSGHGPWPSPPRSREGLARTVLAAPRHRRPASTPSGAPPPTRPPAGRSGPAGKADIVAAALAGPPSTRASAVMVGDRAQDVAGATRERPGLHRRRLGLCARRRTGGGRRRRGRARHRGASRDHRAARSPATAALSEVRTDGNV